MNVQKRHWMATVWPMHLDLADEYYEAEIIEAMESLGIPIFYTGAQVRCRTD